MKRRRYEPAMPYPVGSWRDRFAKSGPASKCKRLDPQTLEVVEIVERAPAEVSAPSQPTEGLRQGNEHEQFWKALSENPRFREAPKSGKGYVIPAAPDAKR
jgi:hypothetical protein